MHANYSTTTPTKGTQENVPQIWQKNCGILTIAFLEQIIKEIWVYITKAKDLWS